jgi:glycine hydroxymethyltransferase
MEAVFVREGVRMLGGGTDNHLLLLDVYGSLGVGGAEAEKILDSVGITLNKNVIADDTRSPMDPSGIRLGTPAMTTRGFAEGECARVAECIVEVLRHKDDAAKLAAIKQEIEALAAAHPIPESFA